MCPELTNQVALVELGSLMLLYSNDGGPLSAGKYQHGRDL